VKVGEEEGREMRGEGRVTMDPTKIWKKLTPLVALAVAYTK